MPMGMVGEACLPSNAYYPRTPEIYIPCHELQIYGQGAMYNLGKRTVWVKILISKGYRRK